MTGTETIDSLRREVKNLRRELAAEAKACDVQRSAYVWTERLLSQMAQMLARPCEEHQHCRERERLLDVWRHRSAPVPQIAEFSIDPDDKFDTEGDRMQACEDARSNAAIADLEAALTVERAARAREQDCGQDGGVCEIAPGCARHWEQRNRELLAERDDAVAAFKDASHLRSEIQRERIKAEDALTAERAAHAYTRELLNRVAVDVELLFGPGGRERWFNTSGIETVINRLRSWLNCWHALSAPSNTKKADNVER